MPERTPGSARVLFVIAHLDPGGSERQLVELIERTHPRQVHASVAVVRPASDMRLTDRLSRLGIEPEVLAPPGAPRSLQALVAARRLGRLLDGGEVDVIYAWLEEAAVIAAPVARLHRIPALVARRNVCGSAIERLAPLRLAIRRAERTATLVTANSEAVREQAVSRGIPAARVRLVENGHPLLPPLPMPDRGIVALGYVAHFRREKGHRRLLDALAALDTPVPWRVDLAGRGPLEGQVREEIGRRGLSDRVSLTGVIDDPRGFWADHEVAVLLSDHEGSPNSLIEAAMAGRPMVGTDSGGTAGVIPADAGFLVGLEEPEATARALRRLIEDPSLRERMGQAAHRHVAQHFSIERFVDGHLAAIEDVMRSDAGPVGKRFEFGANWRRFLGRLDENRIEAAERALAEMLGLDRLDGRTFLDIGSGSGLFSLAAMRLGAQRVHSFDYDVESVACTQELRRRYYSDTDAWRVEQGDATDEAFMSSLGRFDVVYSWGVLHHTGAMWPAIELAASAVAPRGRLFIAIYNDQGAKSRLWRAVKRAYNSLPRLLRPAVVAVFAGLAELAALFAAARRGDLRGWLRSRRTGPVRGMSRWHDHVDWIGGYPFEVATPDQLLAFARRMGFEALNVRTVGDKLGCNEFVFRRAAGASARGAPVPSRS